jgi:hypothetical protein
MKAARILAVLAAFFVGAVSSDQIWFHKPATQVVASLVTVQIYEPPAPTRSWAAPHCEASVQAASASSTNTYTYTGSAELTQPTSSWGTVYQTCEFDWYNSDGDFVSSQSGNWLIYYKTCPDGEELDPATNLCGTCELPNEIDPETGLCGPPSTCSVGLTQTFTGTGVAPLGFCDGSCSWTVFDITVTADGGYIGSYEMTGGECSVTDASDPTPFDPFGPVDPCADSSNEFCMVPVDGPDDTTKEACMTFGAETVCLDPSTGCALVGGDMWCVEPVPECGQINGDLYCLDFSNDPTMPPLGCMSDSSGNVVCVENPPTDTAQTDTTTTTEEDGTITETTTTTNSDGSTTTTVTVINTDGTTSTTTTTEEGGYEEEYPVIPDPDNDQYSSMLDGIYDELTAGMGQDDPGDPGFSNPLDGLASAGCQQISWNLMGHTTSFPGADGCNKLAQLRGYIEWALYIITAMSIIQIALRRPV